ncbi:hypothetical protein [Francisella salimarina]
MIIYTMISVSRLEALLNQHHSPRKIKEEREREREERERERERER